MNIILPRGLSERLATIAAAPCLLVCSDCDGTLAPRPEQAQLLSGTLGPEDIGVKIGTCPSRAVDRVDSEREAPSVLAFFLRHRTSMGYGRIEQKEAEGFEA